MADPEDPLIESPRSYKNRETPRTRIIAVIVVPYLVFLYLLTSFGFGLHDYSARITWGIGGFTILLCFMAIWTANRKYSSRPHRATWTIIQAILLSFATGTGIILGDYLYWTYMHDTYQFHKLNPYVNIDPSRVKGTSIMDAGQVYFKEGTFVATEEALAFEMKDIYCVAPIVRKPVVDHFVEEGEDAIANSHSGSVDFWAVGVNCCMPSGERFRCYDTKNASARSGLRLIRDDLRPFFKLAVDGWSAQYKTAVNHPLFFYWVNDPLAEVGAPVVHANMEYMYFCWGYFLLNIVLCYITHWCVRALMTMK